MEVSTKKIANARINGTILQTIMHNGQPKLVVVDKGKITEEDSWETALDERFEPAETSYIEKGLLVVPTAVDPTELNKVFDDLVGFFKRNVLLQDEDILLLA
ncbi:uncharacterized protein METZ01_LOCUS431772, partial [marine metagenome]